MRSRESCLGTIGDHPDCDLWPSAMSPLPLPLAVICQLELYFYTFLNMLWLQMLVTCPNFPVGKAPTGAHSGETAGICVSLHSHNSSSHPAFDASAWCRVPSHEPNSDPTGWMDHMTLTLYVRNRLLVTQLDSDRAQTGSQLSASVPTFLPIVC